MQPLINDNGITIKQLKELVKDLPETDANGEDFEVWVMNTDGSQLSNIAKAIMQLNQGDIVISITPQLTMADNWIKPTDKLPEDSQHVLVVKYGKTRTAVFHKGSWMGDYFYVWDNGAATDIKDIALWQPLPPPPLHIK